MGADTVSNTLTVTFHCACVTKTTMMNGNRRRLKKREVKAEADNDFATLKVTFQCACEPNKDEENDLKSKENEKSSSNRAKGEGGSKNLKKKKKEQKVKARAQAAAALKQTREHVRQKVKIHYLHLATKNVRSLNSSERFEELTQEVEGRRWDPLLISGT